MNLNRIVNPLVPNMESVALHLSASVESGKLSNGGPASVEFTEQLRQRLGLQDGRHLLLTSSGHTALMAAYACVAKRPLLRAQFCSYTFSSTRLAGTLMGVEMTATSPHPETGCLAPDAVLGDRAVVATCPLSSIPDLPLLWRACRAVGRPLIIDGAATFGTPGVANYGDAFCLSFHATKTLGIGEGGAVIFGSRDACERARAWINFGRHPDGQKAFDSDMGMNAKISEYSAAVGLALLEQINDEIAARRRVVAAYRDSLPVLPSWTGDDTVYAMAPIFVENAQQVRAALRSRGVGHGQYYAPMPGVQDCGAHALYERNICLPCHGSLAGYEIAEIIETVLEAT